MKTPVLEIVALRLDKWGDQTKQKAEGNKIRLSVFFDYQNDNHHVQFPEGADRWEVINALEKLKSLISNQGKRMVGG